MKKIYLLFVPLLFGCVNNSQQQTPTFFNTYAEALPYLSSDFCDFPIDSCKDIITVNATIQDTLYVNGKPTEIVNVDSFYVMRLVSDSILLYYDTTKDLKPHNYPNFYIDLGNRKLMDVSNNEFATSIFVYFNKGNGYWYITKNELPVSLYPSETDDTSDQPHISLFIKTDKEERYCYILQRPTIEPLADKYVILDNPDEVKKFKDWYNK